MLLLQENKIILMKLVQIFSYFNKNLYNLVKNYLSISISIFAFIKEISNNRNMSEKLQVNKVENKLKNM